MRKEIDTERKELMTALGVLLLAIGAVAEADGRFSAEEKGKIEDILVNSLNISREDVKIVLAAVMQAAVSKSDYIEVTRSADEALSYDSKITLIENLFRVAYIDRNIDSRELKVIKDVTDLFHIRKKDFTDIRKRIMKETDKNPKEG